MTRELYTFVHTPSTCSFCIEGAGHEICDGASQQHKLVPRVYDRRRESDKLCIPLCKRTADN